MTIKLEKSKSRAEVVLEFEWLLGRNETRYGIFRRGEKILSLNRGIPEAVAREWERQEVVRVTKTGRAPSIPKAAPFWCNGKHLPPKICRRIESYIKKRVFNSQEQIAALLLRSPKFIEESSSGPVSGGFWRGSRDWSQFCYRWHINSRWNGLDDSLADYIQAGPIAFAQHRKSGGRLVDIGKISTPIAMEDEDPYGSLLALDMGKLTGNFLFLRIDPWTSKNDVDWNKVRELKEECFGDDFRDKRTFPRDLCWYDLLAKHKLPIHSIAKIWAEKRNGLLGDIKALVEDKMRWEEYVSDKSDAWDSRSPFEDAILKATIRIDAYILNIEKYALDFHYIVKF